MPKITPENIHNFMGNNVVTMPGTNSQEIPYVDSNKKLVWASLCASKGTIDNNNTGGRVYFLAFLDPDEAADDDDAFLIYWVQYKEDGPGTATWLGHDAQLMFTATMTGCTFGLGSQTPDGVIAAHVNSAEMSKTKLPDESQKQDQHDKLVKLGNLTAKEIAIDQYMPGDFDMQTKTTPFGYRPVLTGGAVPNRKLRNKVSITPSITSLPWKFCWLKYKMQGTTFTHLGVQQHAGGLF
jgi:hypothetical protein